MDRSSTFFFCLFKKHKTMVANEEKAALKVLRYYSSRSARMGGAFKGSSQVSGVWVFFLFPQAYVYINCTLVRSSPFLFGLQ